MVSYIEINLLAVALAVDCFTVGSSLGIRHNSTRQIFRLSFHFGLFQSLLLLVGILIGSVLLNLIESWDHWIALAILVFLGVRMIVNAIRGCDEDEKCADLSRGFYLIGFSVAVSIDALAAGVGIASVNISHLYTVTVVGLTSSILTFVGIKIGEKVSDKFGKYAEIVAGVVLIGLGVKIAVEHMLGWG